MMKALLYCRKCRAPQIHLVAPEGDGAWCPVCGNAVYGRAAVHDCQALTKFEGAEPWNPPSPTATQQN